MTLSARSQRRRWRTSTGLWPFLACPAERTRRREYLPINPTRNDHKPGSLSINRDSGAWSDFATDDRGGDLVALAAYVLGCRQIEAAERLADHFGIAKPDRQNQRQPNERDAGKGKASPPPAKAPQGAPDGGALCVMPVPADAPAPPAAHSRHGKPAARWAYTDAAGAVCFYHDRYEPKGERKQFSPVTLWRLPDGRLQWQFKAPPAPRPLLGLPDLAAKSGAALIVEGEKARDAAVSLFPENPVITWQGGAQAVSKADWPPLAGRDCWLWPDNDAAGEKAMRDVAAALAAVNAGKVSIFKLAAFARRAIEADGTAALGDADPLADGDDAADLVARGWTAAHAALLLHDPEALRPVEPAAGKAEAANASEAPKTGRFQLDAKGVWLIETDRAPRWVCAPVEPVAMVRDPKNAGWGLLVEFFDPDKTLHRVIVPAALFRGDGAEVAGPVAWTRACGSRRAAGRRWSNSCRPPARKIAPALPSGPAGTMPAPRARCSCCLAMLSARMPANGFTRAKAAALRPSPCAAICENGGKRWRVCAAGIAGCCSRRPCASLRPCCS